MSRVKCFDDSINGAVSRAKSDLVISAFREFCALQRDKTYGIVEEAECRADKMEKKSISF